MSAVLPSHPAPPRPLIVADIGGTNARFGWVGGGSDRPIHVATLATSDHAGPGEAMQAYIKSLPEGCRHAAQTGLHAAWALATALDGDHVAMTNNAWRFSRTAERQRLGLRSLHLANDFEALAYALPHLGADQLRSWDGRMPTLQGALAVIGPGTGLGVAGMVHSPSGWQALPGEGGHATLAPADDFESAVLQHARRAWAHVSAERLLSGIGLPLLHDCVTRAADSELQPLRAEDIVAQGLAGEPRARRTLEVFCAMLGSFAGNVALTLGARGGVFIGGGIVPRLGDFFFQSNFRRRFEDKGRFSTFLAPIPTVLITDTMVALQGAAHFAEHAQRVDESPAVHGAPSAGAASATT